MKTRHLARAIALQTLYSLDINNRIKEVNLPYNEGFAGYTAAEEQALETDVVLYAALLINGVLEHLEELDELISRFSVKRRLENINIVDRNILRISFYTLLYCKEVPAHSVIDEAVKLSQEYSNEVSYRFVNGILDTAVRSLNDSSKN